MKRVKKFVHVSAFLFGILVFASFSSYCAMTAGELAISTSVIGGGGGSGSAEIGGQTKNLYSVCGQSTSTGTSENLAANLSMSAGFIFTLTGVTIESTGAPTMEWVQINGVLFKSGDVISAHSAGQVKMKDELGVATVELQVDGASPVLFTLNNGESTFEGIWSGSINVPEVGTHLLRFFSQDSAGNGKYYDYLAKVMGGAVQVVGRTYNYPNPFSPMSGGSTTIQYVLSTDATITIMIYDITGHEVKRMKFGAGSQGGKGGTNQASWNGKTLGGEVAGNGIYLYKIISGTNVIGSGKLVIFDQ